jgi:hypothetical protein
MSRYRQWTQAYNGLLNSMDSAGIKPQKQNKVIKAFVKENKIQGEYSSQILQISERFNEFKQFIKK